MCVSWVGGVEQGHFMCSSCAFPEMWAVCGARLSVSRATTAGTTAASSPGTTSCSRQVARHRSSSASGSPLAADTRSNAALRERRVPVATRFKLSQTRGLLCPLALLPLLIYLVSSEHLVSSHVLSPPRPHGVSGEWRAVRGCVVFGVWCAVSAGSGPCGITDGHGLPS